MTRPPAQPRRSELSAKDRDDHDHVVAWCFKPQGRELPPEGSPDEDYEVHEFYGALLNSPRFARQVRTMNSLVRGAAEEGDTYSHAEREFVTVVLSYDLGYLGFLSRHTPDAIATGVRLEALQAIHDGHEDDLTDEERQLAAYTRQVTSGTVTDESFAAIEERFGAKGAVELTIFCDYAAFMIRLFQAFGANNASREELGEILRSFRDGSAEMPDWKAWIR